MKSNRSRLWSIILGGMIGLILGVILPYASIDVEGYWKPQYYEVIAPSADRAVELVGYNYSAELLYVKGQTQRIYECSASPFKVLDRNACHEATADAIAQTRNQNPCSAILPSTENPPGHVISRLTTVDCRFNTYTTFAIYYAILDDGSLWRLVYNNFDLTTPFRNCLVVIGAIMGSSIGMGIGATIPKIARRSSKNPHQRSSA